MRTPEGNKGSLALFLTALAVLALATAAVCGVTLQRGADIAREDTDRYLTELSRQTAFKVDQRVSFNLELLGLLGRELAIDGPSEDSRAASVAAYVDNGPFEWIGTVDAAGMLRVDGREVRDVSGLGAVARALAGEAAVSEGLVAVLDEREGALYAAPAPDDPAMGAVVGWVPPERMQLLMDTDTSDGVGFSHVVAENGDFILKSSNGNAVLEGESFFAALAADATFEEGSLAELQRSMEAGESGHVRFSVNGQAREMTFAPLGRGGWYLMSIVPPDAYVGALSAYTAFSVGGVAAVACAAFAAFGGLLLWTSARKNREIKRMAYVDPVTEGHTAARFDQLLARRMGEGRPFTFLSLDIKDFKLVNDFFGKDKGDLTLKYLHRLVVEELAGGEFAARVSSDVFNVVLDDADPARATAWIDRIATRLNAYNHMGDTPYLLALSCGAYLVDDAPLDIVTVRDRANAARKEASASGLSLCSISFCNDADFERILRDKELENRMDDALAKGEFVAYLQPKVSLRDGRPVGAEALVRWISAERGLIPPNDFIPLFERNGFVVKIDLCVFEQACRLVRSWLDAGVDPLPLSVNLSPVHLRIPGFLDAFEQIRARYDVPARYLELELTERVAFENLELLGRVVDEIHELGFTCSMDDFGSGYSSLNVLKDIPVDVLKIDRTFFSSDDERARDVVASVVELAKKLDMGTVAEGVETIPQVEVLRAMRCDAVQGYVFSAPVPADEFERVFLKGEGAGR